MVINNSQKNIVGIQAVADYLKISKNTVYSWVWQKRIPYYKVGRLLKFDLMKVDKWLESRSVDSSEHWN